MSKNHVRIYKEKRVQAGISLTPQAYRYLSMLAMEETYFNKSLWIENILMKYGKEVEEKMRKREIEYSRNPEKADRRRYVKNAIGKPLELLENPIRKTFKPPD